MKVLYLTNPQSEFGEYIPKVLKLQGLEVLACTHEIHADDTVGMDYIISDRYSNKISNIICNDFDGKSLNLHSSFLPFFRGSYPVLFSILNGKVPGWSIHRISEKIDCGEILCQKKINLDLQSDTLRTAWLRCQLEMMTYLVTNFLYFTKQNCFPEFKAKPSNVAGQFHFRKDFKAVSDLLTNGWDTPVSQIFGLRRS